MVEAMTRNWGAVALRGVIALLLGVIAIVWPGPTVVHWQSMPPVRTTDPNPHEIVLSLSLTGPFGSVDALKQATSQGLKPTGVRTVNAAPVSVDDRIVLSAVSQLDLPADLPSGYYNLASQAAEAGGSAGGGAIVIVVP